ncbi:hypothetical protein L2E82_11179 [Cichorium intybus]|uniref:Uncharacterized protein n=1 Tax=Cichorium intybus TaxID=13427 RepID=A0ACB9GCL1_CICIN|nr:hypothetical protein L2E82_11179 [Cichorium intybus]
MAGIVWFQMGIKRIGFVFGKKPISPESDSESQAALLDPFLIEARRIFRILADLLLNPPSNSQNPQIQCPQDKIDCYTC